jgi:hypothetical protein
MKTRRLLTVILLAAATLGGCATTSSPGGTPRAACDPTTKFDGPIPSRVAEGAWEPDTRLPPGFLVTYYLKGNDGITAVGVYVVHAEGKVQRQEVAFVVGPLPEAEIPPQGGKMREGWPEFFTKLNRFQALKPGGLACERTQQCHMTPQGPPPDLIGSNGVTAGGTGGSASRDELWELRYAQIKGDYVGGGSEEQRELVSRLVNRTVCAAGILAGTQR